MLFNSDNQVEFFAKTISLSAVVSFAFAIYVTGEIFRPVGATYFLCFNFVWILVFLTLNEILMQKRFQRRVPLVKKAVLITGCDRGFGSCFAQRLGDAGFQVFAGCLDPVYQEALQLKTNPRIHCIKMDVTKAEEIQLAFDYVLENLQGNELWAVINNAGISRGSDIETTHIKTVQDVLDVNLLGTIRVTKAFLPLLRESRGRVINIASAAGRLTLPGFLPYSMSKTAIIAFTDGLRFEMKRHGVGVVSIEPWIYRTKLSDIRGISNQLEREWSSSNAKSSCNIRMMKESAERLFNWGVSNNLNEVIDVIEEAVTLKYPLYRYSPGKWYLNCMMWFMNFIPKPLSDVALCYFIFKR